MSPNYPQKGKRERTEHYHPTLFAGWWCGGEWGGCHGIFP